jgi:hypothetical protein
MDKGIPLSPVVRLRLAWAVLFVSLLGLVLSLVFLRGEPMLTVTLALSWLALVWTSWDILSTADVRKQQEGGGE